METQPVEKTNGMVQLFVFAEIVGLLAIVLVFFWCVKFNSGFGFESQPLFNWHPLFMTIGLIYLMGNGMLFFYNTIIH